jgi:hypothetical protein
MCTYDAIASAVNRRRYVRPPRQDLALQAFVGAVLLSERQLGVDTLTTAARLVGVSRSTMSAALSAVLPLLECLPPHTKFYEPCRGENDLVGHLTAAGHVLVGSSDEELDARTTQYRIPEDSVFISNPPWDRPTLHAILTNLSNQAPAWLLIDADWAHTRQSIPYLPRLRTIVATGRHRWIPGTKFTSKDNACWHLFNKPRPETRVVNFFGRTESAIADPKKRAA